MAELSLKVLSDSEIEQIHEGSLELLQKTGFRVCHAGLRHLLRGAGAQCAPNDDRVYLPPDLVRESLAGAPSSFSVSRQDGKTIRAGEQRMYCSLVIDPWIIDYPSGAPRRPVVEDVVRHVGLGDAHPMVDAIYRMDIEPSDIPRETACVKTLEILASGTTKHLLACPGSLESMHDWLEVAEILAGGDGLQKKPVITMSAAVTSPLTLNDVNAQILHTAVSRGIPLITQNEPIAGMSAPLSFAGGLLMAIAEMLFLVVLSQLVRRGAPVFLSTGNALAELQTGRALYYPLDKILWQIANLQIAQFYRIPMWSSLGGSLVGRYDPQWGIENTLLMLPVVTCGTNFLNGLGSCFNACGMSPEMIVMQADLAGLLERVGRGMDIGDNALALDSIMRRGPGGSFLEEQLTIDNLRSGEFFSGGCFDTSGENSRNDQGDAMLAKAHQRVAELLDGHRTAQPEAVVESIRRWAREKRASLGHG